MDATCACTAGTTLFGPPVPRAHLERPLRLREVDYDPCACNKRHRAPSTSAMDRPVSASAHDSLNYCQATEMGTAIIEWKPPPGAAWKSENRYSRLSHVALADWRCNRNRPAGTAAEYRSMAVEWSAYAPRVGTSVEGLLAHALSGGD